MPKKPKQSISSNVEAFLEHVFTFLDLEEGAVRCYRGQANDNWDPVPSVLRDGLKPNAESGVISELTTETPEEFDHDTSMFRKLVRAQHFGLPTRLLDVSLNPLLALFFACHSEAEKENDGIVKVFDFSPNRIKFGDSDVISLICNLSRLSDRERSTLEKESDFTDESLEKRKPYFRELPEMKRLTQFVRIEKPYFLDIVNPRDLRRYFFVYPYKTNKRVIAQSGAFISGGLLEFAAPARSKGLDIHNIIIPAASKRNILKELDILNVNSRTLFPDIQSISTYIKNKWKE